MSRLHSAPVDEAEGKAATLFKAIKGAVGFVPNAYADIGTNSPEALEFVLGLDAVIRKTSLTLRDVETIRLVMSHTSGCDYCLAAHTVYAERAGISQEMIRLLLHRDASGDTRLDAVAAFTHELAKKSGRVSDEAISAVRLAGLSDRQITEVLLVMAGITFTNLFNRVNDTVLDFPTPDLA